MGPRIALAILTLFSAAVAAEAPGPYEVLRQAAYHEGDVPHCGRSITVFRGPLGKQVRLARTVYAGRRGQSDIRYAGGEGFPSHRIVCNGEKRWRIIGQGGVVLVSKAVPFEVERQRRLEWLDRMGEFVRVRTRPGRVLDRPTWTVSIQRRDMASGEWVDARELSIDQETWLELGNVTYGAEGEVVARTTFESLSYLDEEDIDPERFRYRPDENTLVLPEPTRLGFPMPFRDATKQAPWLTPLCGRPKEWRPKGIAVHRYGRQAVGQFYYVMEPKKEGDPPRPVVFFQKPVGQPAPYFDDYYSLAEVGSEPVRRSQAVAWSDGRLVYVLASPLPAEWLARVARRHNAGANPRAHEHRER